MPRINFFVLSTDIKGKINEKDFFGNWIFALIATTSQANARDTEHYMLIDDALNSSGANEALSPEIKLHFAGEKRMRYQKKLGTFTTNRKTNAVFKSDKTSCEWAMLSALKTLQERALKEGGNAVINIESYYNKNPYQSTSKYECHAGATVTGVALRGTVVKR